MLRVPLSLRIILLVIITSTVLVGGLLITVYKLMINDYQALVMERESAKIDRLVSELELSQQQRLLGLEGLASRVLNQEGQLYPPSILQALLQKPSVARHLFPDGILIFDAQATLIAESDYVPGRLGTNYADRPHFQRAKQTQQPVISEPILGRRTGLPLISYIHPLVTSEGEILGYLGGSLDLSKTPLLNKQVATNDSANLITIIIDPTHRLFVSMQQPFDKPEPLPAEGVNPLVDAAVSLSPAGTLVNYQQQRYLQINRSLQELGWVVLRAIPYTEAMAPAQTSFHRLLLITLIATSCIGLAGIGLAHSLTKPIEKMTRRIDQMADSGRFDGNFLEQGGPEVCALARAMNRLAEQRKTAEIALSQAERFLATVLDAASEISIIATNKHGLITAFNAGAEHLLGYSKHEMIGKQTPASLHLEEEVAARSVELTALLGYPVEGFRVFVDIAEQENHEKREWTYVHKNGRHIPVSLIVTTMRNEAGEITGYLGIAEDITEYKRMNKMKSEFISTVSHELRTPLTSISGALGLIIGSRFEELPDKTQKLLKTAHRNSQRLSHLINDLLDIEKIAAGKLHFDMRLHELTPLVEQAIETNQHYGSSRDVSIRLICDANTVLVHVDSQRLLQVLANLLSNAIKFSSDHGQVIVEVTTDNSKAIVSVIDQGPGINQAFRERIFQRFAQADSSDTRAKEGTGLGLAISRELIERMGGQIDFESTMGKGSRFFFVLPLVSPLCTLKSDSNNDDTHPPTGRILVVEDNVDVAKLLAIMLSDAGYQVDICYNGADALQAIHSRTYDLISLDLMLPDISGLAIIRQLRQQTTTATIPIVVVSATIEQGRLALNGDGGGIEWLSKPIDQQQLIHLVQQQLSLTSPYQPHVLHVEDDSDLHEVIREMAGDSARFELASTLAQARLKLQQASFDVLLLDLNLPDGSGWELLSEAKLLQPEIKIVILSGKPVTQHQHDQVEAVLLKSRLSTTTLLEGIHSRIKTYRSQQEVN
ncbi:response regulator [Vibrio metschnikovii]|uniref:response regulator n=1 Tax=Vibrio metschnikovii TaxID=28172 RepID=UPI001C2FD88D|nr:response regulator [Vibrio metschnikovii]